jgi:hypothetical protein
MSLIYGRQTTTEITPILVDSAGRVLVSNTSPSLFQPLAKSKGFSNGSLPAGTSNQYGHTVPAGETHRLTGFSAAYSGTVAGVSLYFVVNNLTSQLIFHYINPVVNNAYYLDLLNILLSPGWQVGVVITGATLNDDIFENIFLERVY